MLCVTMDKYMLAGLTAQFVTIRLFNRSSPQPCFDFFKNCKVSLKYSFFFFSIFCSFLNKNFSVATL